MVDSSDLSPETVLIAEDLPASAEYDSFEDDDFLIKIQKDVVNHANENKKVDNKSIPYDANNSVNNSPAKVTSRASSLGDDEENGSEHSEIDEAEERESYQLRNLFDCAVQSPNIMKTYAKQAAVIVRKHDFSSFDNPNKVLRVIIDKLTDALVEKLAKTTADALFRFVAYVDVLENQLGSENNTMMSVVSELVELSSRDRRETVRVRVCSLMEEVLILESEGAQVMDETLSDEHSPQTSQKENVTKSDIFDSDSDEDLIVEFDGIRTAPVKHKNMLESQIVDERTFRAIAWATVLGYLRLDKSSEVRAAAVRTISRLPDLKVVTRGKSMKNGYPDDLVIQSLSDISLDVRQTAVNSFAFTSPEVLDKVLDVLEYEEDSQIRLRLLRRMINDVNLFSFKDKQQTRLIDVVFGDTTKGNSLLAMGTMYLVPKWLKTISEDKVYLSDVVSIVDPIQKNDAAEKIFKAAASSSKFNDVSDGSVLQWIRILRKRASEARNEEEGETLLMNKEIMSKTVRECAISDLSILCHKLFTSRCLAEFSLEQSRSPTEKDEAISRIFPNMHTLAGAASKLILSISTRLMNPSCSQSKSNVKEQEFLVKELCKIMRLLDRTDCVGRKSWRTFLTHLIIEDGIVQDGDLLREIMIDLVDNATETKEESEEVVEEIVYGLHSLLTGDEALNEGEGEPPIKEEAVERCAILLEAILRNSSVDNYSPVLKSLVLKLVEEATAHDNVRPIGCRIIALAGAMDEQVLNTHSHILDVLLRTLKDEKRTRAACLLGLSDLAIVHGTKELTDIIYLDDCEEDETGQGKGKRKKTSKMMDDSFNGDESNVSDDDEEYTPEDTLSTTKDEKNKNHEKIHRFMKLFQNCMLDEDPDVSLTALVHGLRLMLAENAKWASVMGIALAAVHTSGASPILKTALDSFLDHEIKSDNVYDRMFLVSSMWNCMNWFEEEQYNRKMNIGNMLNYVYEKIRECSSSGPKVKKEVFCEGSQTSISEIKMSDHTSEYSFLLVLFYQLRTFPDSDLCVPISKFIASMPLHKFIDRPCRVKYLMKKVKNCSSRLSLNDQPACVSALDKVLKKLDKINANDKKSKITASRKRKSDSEYSSIDNNKATKKEPLEMETEGQTPRVKEEVLSQADSENFCQFIGEEVSAYNIRDDPLRPRIKDEIISQMKSQCVANSSVAVPDLKKVKLEVDDTSSFEVSKTTLPHQQLSPRVGVSSDVDLFELSE